MISETLRAAFDEQAREAGRLRDLNRVDSPNWDHYQEVATRACDALIRLDTHGAALDQAEKEHARADKQADIAATWAVWNRARELRWVKNAVLAGVIAALAAAAFSLPLLGLAAAAAFAAAVGLGWWSARASRGRTREADDWAAEKQRLRGELDAAVRTVTHGATRAVAERVDDGWVGMALPATRADG